jgi:hypothetical protein
MALITKNTKTGGGTDITAGQVFNAADLNTDMNTVVNLANGNIDNDNIKSAAAIAYSKLNLSSSITSSDLVDGTIVNADVNASAAIALTKCDDISATDDAHDDTTTPGTSASHTLPTTLSGELQQMRYAVERLGLGVAASRYDATGTREAPFWGDLPARGMQRLPGFNGVTVAGLPSGWTNVATATLAQEAADAADGLAGKGRAIKITAAGSANEGISFTLSGLKESTVYFVAALMKATAADTARLDVTGGDATSSFRNFTADVTATTWTWAYGLVATDSTPTSLVVRCLAAADTDIVWVADVQYGECSAVPQVPRVAVVEQLVASTTGTEITGSTTDAGLDTNFQFVDNGSTDLDLTVYIPGDGYYVKVSADYTMRETSSQTGNPQYLKVRLYQSINGGALASVREIMSSTGHTGTTEQTWFNGSLTWIIKAPVPGQSYRYALAATIDTASSSNVTPQLGNVGSSSLTVAVQPY